MIFHTRDLHRSAHILGDGGFNKRQAYFLIIFRAIINPSLHTVISCLLLTLPVHMMASRCPSWRRERPASYVFSRSPEVHSCYTALPTRAVLIDTN